MAKPMHGRVQLAFHGAFGKAKRLGDLPELESLVVPHDENDALPRWEAGYRRLEDLPELSGRR